VMQVKTLVEQEAATSSFLMIIAIVSEIAILTNYQFIW